MRLAFSGKARSGKDTSADYVKLKLLSTARVRSFAFADFSKKILECTQNILGKEQSKIPFLLQVFSEGLKDYYGRDLFSNLVREKIKSIPLHEHILISDLRFPEEYDMLKEMEFTLIRVERSNRPIDRDITHISEIALDKHVFDFTIYNNSDIPDLEKKLDKILDVTALVNK